EQHDHAVDQREPRERPEPAEAEAQRLAPARLGADVGVAHGPQARRFGQRARHDVDHEDQEQGGDARPFAVRCRGRRACGGGRVGQRQRDQHVQDLDGHDHDRDRLEHGGEPAPVDLDAGVEDLPDPERSQLRRGAHRRAESYGVSTRAASSASPTRALWKTGYRARTRVASPCPPPPHSAAAPSPPPRRRNSLTSVTTSRVPAMPIGWPSAIAPPLTFTTSSEMPRSCMAARPTAANASLISNRSMSETDLSTGSSARLMARDGCVRSDGSGPATMPKLTSSAMGVAPSSEAFSGLVTMTAAAPSEIWDALPAVIVPSLANAGFT